MQYRKKPIIIDAIQFTGVNVQEINVQEIIEFTNDTAYLIIGIDGIPSMIIPTLEGDHKANVGDWIIKGIAGEFYPCKPDIFTETYEVIDNETK